MEKVLTQESFLQSGISCFHLSKRVYDSFSLRKEESHHFSRELQQSEQERTSVFPLMKFELSDPKKLVDLG